MRYIAIIDETTREIRGCYSPDVSGDLSAEEIEDMFVTWTREPWFEREIDADSFSAWAARRTAVVEPITVDTETIVCDDRWLSYGKTVCRSVPGVPNWNAAWPAFAATLTNPSGGIELSQEFIDEMDSWPVDCRKGRVADLFASEGCELDATGEALRDVYLASQYFEPLATTAMAAANEKARK